MVYIGSGLVEVLVEVVEIVLVDVVLVSGGVVLVLCDRLVPDGVVLVPDDNKEPVEEAEFVGKEAYIIGLAYAGPDWIAILPGRPVECKLTFSDRSGSGTENLH